MTQKNVIVSKIGYRYHLKQSGLLELITMTQTSNRVFDELAKIMTDAAGAAHGVKKEVENLVRAQAERMLNEMNVVQREEFDAVKAMAQKAREENERLEQKIAELEAKLADK